MVHTLVFPVGSTPACHYACSFIKEYGIELVDHPTPEVTHLLLDIPSFNPDRTLPSGGDLQHVLQMLPTNIVVCGGNLANAVLNDYETLDFLQDEDYLAANASITADCALRVAAPLMKTTFQSATILILGWGRIGKCLGHLLKAIGADVIIAARKEPHRAMLRALGFQSVDIADVASVLSECQIVFNTIPDLIVHKEILSPCRNCVKIDLASTPGLEGEDVVWARGLPGIHTPASSGKLIADTFLRHLGR